jgi:predicted CopG family antitoxin
VQKEVYDKLQKAKQAEGKSFADILKTGLGIVEARREEEEEEESRKKAQSQGYNKGYAQAERLYKVTYPCNICRKTITLNSLEEKKAASQYMQQHGWGHGACHRKGQ